MIRITETENGYVRGIAAADSRITVFKGIPFAAPPVGKMRWRAPKPAENWIGVKDCTEFSPISMQNIPGLNSEQLYSREWNVDPDIPMSEDCLYLNIWTPKIQKDKKLPVYVWFFGGALQFGNTAEMELDGERLARRGIVVVTVNYRLNVFGFMAHPQLTAESPEAPTNFGSLDQQRGILWVRNNIAAFGGNPENITIGGQSAGGGSVLTQLNAPENRECIKRAVVESGVFLNPYEVSPYTTLEEMEKKGILFFDFLGVKSLEEARKLPAEFIRRKNEEFGIYWWSSIDGVFQKDYFYTSLVHGKLPDIPMMLGYTESEFIQPAPAKDFEQLTQFAIKQFGCKADEFIELVTEDAKDYSEILENSSIHTISLAIQVALAGMKYSGKKQPVFCYEFTTNIPGEDCPGTFHSSDLWFFFETLSKCWRPFTGVHYDLSRQMCNYLANFIGSGNPNGKDIDGTPMKYWQAYEEENSSIMVFNDKPYVRKWNRDKLTGFFMNLDMLK